MNGFANRFNPLVLTLLVAHGCACGGTADGTEPAAEGEQVTVERDGFTFVYDADGRLLERIDPPVVESELGQSAQPLMSAPMGTMQLGFDIWRNERACVPGDDFQDCTIPRKKAIRYFVTGNATGANALANTEGLIHVWYQTMVGKGLSQSSSGWLFSEATSLSDPNLTIVVSANPADSCTGSSASGNSCFSGSIHGIQAVDVDGNYSTWNGVPVLHIDYDRIVNDATLTPTQKNNLLIQAVFGGMLRFGGVGLVDTTDARCNSSALLKNDVCTIRTAHACAFNGFGDVGNQNQFWIGGANCGS